MRKEAWKEQKRKRKNLSVKKNLERKTRIRKKQRLLRQRNWQPLQCPDLFPFRAFLLSDDEEDGDGRWIWDGVQEESEVEPIDQDSYDSDHTGHTFVVRDHRTEGELHINKRDLELYEEDEEDSYGKSQGDATLEGAVYGLYAAEDIVHPDGKTGKVFSAGELVAIATTDKNGDASFLVITEESETSKNVPNLYEDNVANNGNGWIGRPLILGSYYVEEISRSEGYELSRTGKNLSESNRTGTPVVLTATGSASTDGFYHEINEWDGSSYDFDVDYYDTDGFEIHLSGLPANAEVYEVATQDTTTTEQVMVGTERVEKKDSQEIPSIRRQRVENISWMRTAISFSSEMSRERLFIPTFKQSRP